MPFFSSRTKTIWIINHFAIHPDAPGGTRHYDFGMELAERGYEVIIFAAGFNYMLRRRVARGESCIHPPVTEDLSYVSWPRRGSVRFVWVSSLRYRKNNWRRAANMLGFALNVIALGAVRKHPDVIIGSSPHLFSALSAYILARIKGSRFYLEVRDLWPQVLIDMRERRARGSVAHALNSMLYAIVITLLRGIESLLYRKADRIIVLSEGSGKYIIERGIDPEKISLLPNGVYLEQFNVSDSRANVRERLGLNGKFVVMYAGAHGPANALDTIIRAAEIMQGRRAGRGDSLETCTHCSEVAFVLVGDGPARDELTEMVMVKGLDNVKMLPAVPKSSIPDLFNAADALVITLRSVNLFSYGVSPNKLFEYMASGRPILCAVGGDIASLVERANAGVAVEPENPDALVEAILSLMEDSYKCLIYGANGRRFVEEHFSRSRIVEDLVSILDTWY